MNGGQLAALERFLAPILAEGGQCRVLKHARLATGQSRAMYRVEAECTPPGGLAAVRRVLVRVEQHGLLGGDPVGEVAVMNALNGAGLPVARVLAYEQSDGLLGQPFFVMEELPGISVHAPETVGPYVTELQRLHAVDWRQPAFAFMVRPEGTRDSALGQVERWYGVYRWSMVGEPSPLVEECAEWLRIHAPETAAPVIVHGDPGPGNYLHLDGGVTGLVDWEFTHLGDAEEDWAYLISMRGAGVMAEADWVRYLGERGVPLDPERLRYWKALNFFKGACLDMTAMKLYMEGTNPAPNLLAIATGVHLSALKRLAETTVL